jgi:hypothetical protein
MISRTTTKWVLFLIFLCYAGAALFCSPYLGLNAQIGLECPFCPHVLSPEDPHIKFISLTLLFGLLNSAILLLVGATVRFILIALRSLP